MPSPARDRREDVETRRYSPSESWLAAHKLGAFALAGLALGALFAARDAARRGPAGPVILAGMAVALVGLAATSFRRAWRPGAGEVEVGADGFRAASGDAPAVSWERVAAMRANEWADRLEFTGDDGRLLGALSFGLAGFREALADVIACLLVSRGPGPEREWRQPAERRELAFVLIGGAGAAGVGLALVVAGQLQLGALLGLAIPFGLVLVEGWRVRGVRVDERGVEVRTWLGRRLVPFAELAAVRPDWRFANKRHQLDLLLIEASGRVTRAVPIGADTIRVLRVVHAIRPDLVDARLADRRHSTAA